MPRIDAVPVTMTRIEEGLKQLGFQLEQYGMDRIKDSPNLVTAVTELKDQMLRVRKLYSEDKNKQESLKHRNNFVSSHLAVELMSLETMYKSLQKQLANDGVGTDKEENMA